jgi:hypothetical protein
VGEGQLRGPRASPRSAPSSVLSLLQRRVFRARPRLRAGAHPHRLRGRLDPRETLRRTRRLPESVRQDVAINVYPDAHHSFDQARGVNYLPAVTNAADCTPQAPSILGPLSVGITSCLKKGATVGGSPSAAEQARKNLRAQLEELMK